MKSELKEFIRSKISKKDKAVNSVWTAVLGVISALDLTDEYVLEFLSDAKQDKIFKSLNFLNGGNWIEEVENPNHIKFLKALFQTCPKGIGTPNAASGEGELMLMLSSPRLKKPAKNDIQIEGEGLYNLKDDKPRIFAKISGKSLNKIMMKEVEKLSLIPVESRGKSVHLVNPEYVKKNWNPQFSNLSEEQVSGFLGVFLSSLFPEKTISQEKISNILNKCLIGNQLNWEIWIEELIIHIFENGDDKNENLISMTVDGDVKVIPSNVEKFSESVRNKTIKFSGDYFRMFQDYKVGIYLKF